jgi:hypothetical protein
MNIVRVNIEFFNGYKKIKERRIWFVLGYLRMIWWNNSTAISIKHRILATFNINKKNQFERLYAFRHHQTNKQTHQLNCYTIDNQTCLSRWGHSSVNLKLYGRTYIYNICSQGRNECDQLCVTGDTGESLKLIFFWLTLKVANIRCFKLIAVELFHHIIRK